MSNFTLWHLWDGEKENEGEKVWEKVWERERERGGGEERIIKNWARGNGDRSNRQQFYLLLFFTPYYGMRNFTIHHDINNISVGRANNKSKDFQILSVVGGGCLVDWVG